MSQHMTTEDDYRDLVPPGDPAGSVLAGVHAATGQAWALKVLPERLDRRTRTEVEGELRRLAPAAQHAPIVVGDRIVELGDGRRAVRRELLAQSLPELIAAFGPLSVPDTLALGSALAEALAAAGVVHGGVTPGNVLFRASGEPVLTDFGVALRRAFPPDGDPSFRAPETIRDGIFDAPADRYGLGAILYLALTGKPPFPRRPGEADGDHVLRVLIEPPPPIDRDDLPPGLSTLVTELLAKDPAQRPADPAARLARPELPAAVPLGKPILEFGPERQRRRPSPPVLAGAAVVALLAVVAVLLVLSRPQDMEVPPMDPPLAAPSAAVPSPSTAAVRLELADPVDRGTVVELSWTSSAELRYGVTIAPDGEQSRTDFVQDATSYRVEVDPVRRYCFEIRGTDGRSLYVSAPKAIRGATCRR
jgi:serine/threonine protein kinase